MTNFLKVLDITEDELKTAILKDYEMTIDYYLKEFTKGHTETASTETSASL